MTLGNRTNSRTRTNQIFAYSRCAAPFQRTIPGRPRMHIFFRIHYSYLYSIKCRTIFKTMLIFVAMPSPMLMACGCLSWPKTKKPRKKFFFQSKPVRRRHMVRTHTDRRAQWRPKPKYTRKIRFFGVSYFIHQGAAIICYLLPIHETRRFLKLSCTAMTATHWNIPFVTHFNYTRYDIVDCIYKSVGLSLFRQNCNYVSVMVTVVGRTWQAPQVTKH